MKKICIVFILILCFCSCTKYPVSTEQFQTTVLFAKHGEGYEEFLIRFTEWKNSFLDKGLVIYDIRFAKLYDCRLSGEDKTRLVAILILNRVG